MKIEKEAKAYVQQKRKPPAKPKPLTSRRYLAGMAMAGLLANNRGTVRLSDLKKEAFSIADAMLEED